MSSAEFAVVPGCEGDTSAGRRASVRKWVRLRETETGTRARGTLAQRILLTRWPEAYEEQLRVLTEEEPRAGTRVCAGAWRRLLDQRPEETVHAMLPLLARGEDRFSCAASLGLDMHGGASLPSDLRDEVAPYLEQGGRR